MTLSERALGRIRTRADRVRERRARLVREIEPVSRERRVKPRRRKQPRRRYDFTLSSETGVEARLPSIPVIRVGPRLLTFLLLVAVLFGIGHVFSSPAFHVEQAIVHNNKLLNNAQVRSIAQVDGSSIFLIDTREVTERLLKLPEVYAAWVQLSWPNQVEIKLEERQPVVEWNDGGRIWWLSADGLAFIKHGSRPDLVRVEAEKPVLRISEKPLEPVIAPKVIQAAVLLMTQLPELEALKFDSEHGLSFEDALGRKVYLGSEGDITLKIRIYQAIVQQLLDQRFQVAEIHVENQAAPYYRVMR